MHVAYNGDIATLPPQWEHDPTLRDNCGWTVAMIIARHKDIAALPPQWEHDPTLRDNCG